MLRPKDPCPSMAHGNNWAVPCRHVVYMKGQSCCFSICVNWEKVHYLEPVHHLINSYVP